MAEQRCFCNKRRTEKAATDCNVSGNSPSACAAFFVEADRWYVRSPFRRNIGDGTMDRENLNINVDQKALDDQQIAEFYHENFVKDQVRDFGQLLGSRDLEGSRLIDLGGGIGHFAAGIRATYGCQATVLDSDPASVAACHLRNIPAVLGDALTADVASDFDLASLNLVIHHLVGKDFFATRHLQVKVLNNQISGSGPTMIFVNEYIYDSFVYAELASRVIFGITSSATLSAIGRRIARFVPSLSANTFGVGVRFHSYAGWRQIFEEAGWRLGAHARGVEEHISLPRRVAFLLKSCRRDSFVLVR